MMGDIVKLVQDAAGAERRECSVLAELEKVEWAVERGRYTFVEKVILVLSVECQTSLLGFADGPALPNLSLYIWEGQTDREEGEQ